MQVNLNTNMGQSRPQFKALKGVRFEGEAIRNSAIAQKNLLTIFDNPKIKKLFEKYDGEVVFTSNTSYNFGNWHNLDCMINIFNNFNQIHSKIKQEYIEKAKKSNVSSEIFDNAKFDRYLEKGHGTYLYRGVCLVEPDYPKLSERLVDTVNKSMNDSEVADALLVEDLEKVEPHIRNVFDPILKKEIQLLKDSSDEVVVKDEVANKLKELLG